MEELQSFLIYTEAHIPWTLWTRPPGGTLNTYLTLTLTCGSLTNWDVMRKPHQGTHPVFAFSPNMVKDSFTQTCIRHTDVCPPVTHLSCPCVDVNKQHPRQQRTAPAPELFSHGDQYLGHSFASCGVLLCLEVVRSGVWFGQPALKKKPEPTFKNWEICKNIWIWGYSWKLQGSINLASPVAWISVTAALCRRRRQFLSWVRFCPPKSLLPPNIRSLCPLPFVIELTLLFFSS